MWDLALRMGHQVRAIPGAVLGFDFVAAFALAEALGINRAAVAHLLPEIEAVAIQRINERMRQDRT